MDCQNDATLFQSKQAWLDSVYDEFGLKALEAEVDPRAVDPRTADPGGEWVSRDGALAWVSSEERAAARTAEAAAEVATLAGVSRCRVS